MGIAFGVPIRTHSPSIAPIRAAYADPPYIGQARKHYRREPLCAEVDHTDLINQLETYDTWALSCSSPSLQYILSLCPATVRVAAWVKPFAIFKVGVNPAYAWEPVIFRPSTRKRERTEPTIRDWVSANITLRRGLCGVKPDAFNRWLIDLLGLKAGDKLVELFPGSGGLSQLWQEMQ